MPLASAPPLHLGVEAAVTPVAAAVTPAAAAAAAAAGNTPRVRDEAAADPKSEGPGGEGKESEAAEPSAGLPRLQQSEEECGAGGVRRSLVVSVMLERDEPAWPRSSTSSLFLSASRTSCTALGASHNGARQTAETWGQHRDWTHPGGATGPVCALTSARREVVVEHPKCPGGGPNSPPPLPFSTFPLLLPPLPSSPLPTLCPSFLPVGPRPSSCSWPGQRTGRATLPP